MDLISKIPPQALELEEAVLGSIILEAESLERIADIISAKSFYNQKNQIIAAAIFEMAAQNQTVDTLTLSNHLKKLGKLEEVGGIYQLTMFTNKVTGAANIEQHAQIIQQKYLAREVIRLTSKFLNKAYNDTTDIFDLISEVQEVFSKLGGFNSSNIKHISESLKGLIEQIDFNLSNQNPLTGVPTGITEFDVFSGGLQKGDLIVIAGETSQGKTSLALNIALHAAKCNYKIAIYSCEMTDRQLAARMLADDAQLSGKAIQIYKLNPFQLEKVNRAIANIENLPVYIDEMPNLRYDYLERSIRAMVLKENTELIVVDYLQLIQSSDNRKDKTAAMAEISNNLKALARTLKVPIILISQLTRDKLNPKPTIGRLKGSGDIENAADIVWAVWHPIKYEYPNFDCNMQTYKSDGLAYHIIAKGRNIGTTEFVTQFNGPTTKFSDYAIAEQFERNQLSIENPY